MNAGVPVPGNVISAVNAAYMIVTLEKMSAEFQGTPLQTAADTALISQADYIIQHFKNPLGGFYNSYQITVGPDSNPQKLASSAALARALYVAYRATGNNTYLQEADAGYNFIINNFYKPQSHIFETELNNTTATYTPWEVAITSGLLREATLIGNHPGAAAIYTRFFKSVVNKMQLTEAEQTGETGADSDGDGIPYIAGGHKPFVLVHQVSFDTTAIIDKNTLSQINLQMYPNPTTNQVNFALNNLTNAKQLQINIFDLTGKKVLTIARDLNSGSQSIGINTKLPSGLYLVRTSFDNDIIKISKLIIR